MKFFKHITTVTVGFFVATCFIVSCQKADIKFGQEFIENSSTDIIRLDTFSVDVSTVFNDSFPTSAQGQVFCGGYTDNLLGRITTKSFFEIAPPLYQDKYANCTLDSVVFICNNNNIFYGDSTVPVTININELKDSIYVPEFQTYLFNTSNFGIKTVITSANLKINPTSPREIAIKMPTAFGQNWFNKLKDNTDKDMKSNIAFLSYFKGICLTTNASSEIVFSIKDDAKIRFYYKKPGAFQTNESVDFNMSNSYHQFSNISINRTGLVQNLGRSQREIPSTVSGNTAFTQSVSGTMIKLRFPSLSSIAKIPNFAKLLRADLIIKPIKASYNFVYKLPPTLRLAQTNVLNTIGPSLAYFAANGASAEQLGLLTLDYATGEKTQYTYDLTQYIKSKLEENNANSTEGLLLIPQSPNFETAFERLAIGNKFNNLGYIKLQLYYAAIK
jgi:Domain of unknown function (DUF4270)